MDDLVSIITPAYNAEKYILDTINSVKSQEYKNWEMIIVDDASTDRTTQLVSSEIEKDNRIRLIKLEKNKGVANARNVAITNSNGRFISFLDSDDLWDKNKLELQIVFMLENDIGFSYTNYSIFDDRNNKVIGKMKSPRELTFSRLLLNNPIGCLTVMIDRNKVEKIQFPRIKHEDYATWLSLIKLLGEGKGLDKTLASYRVVSNSVSSNKVRTLSWTWKIYRKHLSMGYLHASLRICIFTIATIFKYVIHFRFYLLFRFFK